MDRARGAPLDWLRGSGALEFKHSFEEWIGRVSMLRRFGTEGRSSEQRLEELRTMLAERIEEWTRPWLEEGREQGIEEGRAQGRELGREQGLAEERSLLCRQAARKLGGATAGWLPGLLDGLTAPGPLAEVGDWIIGCDTGEDLFDRTSRLLRRSCSFAAGAPTVQAAGRTRAPPPPMFTLEYMREMLADGAKEWRRVCVEKGREQGFAEGRKQGIEQGIEEGRAEQRSLLCRQAARKFDGETAGRLSGLLDGLAAPGPLAEVGEWIIDCDTGEDLLDRTSRMLRRASSFTAGGGVEGPNVRASAGETAPPPSARPLEGARTTPEERRKQQIDQWVDECIQHGIQRGLKQGMAEQRSLLCRQAWRKFDGETAGRLSRILDDLTAPEPLVEVGEWIIDCDTGEDLLDRTSRMIRPS